MSAPFSIVLTDVAWSTPDGRPLLSQLSFGFAPERTGLVGRNGVGKSTLIRLVTGELRPAAGAVCVSGRLGVLRQTVQVDPGETVADLFGVAPALQVLARAEAGAATEEDLAVADWTLEARMAAALASVGLEAAPATPLASLSGGQRTRAALAALVFDQPDVLILDEPTNNLDAEGRAAVAQLLHGWAGAAIVVSHDRALLEEMDAIVELTSLGARRYGGGWSAYREQKALELAAAQADMADAEKRLDELARRAQSSVEKKARKDAGGRRKAARGDAPKILLGAMKDRSEDTGGAQSRLAERRRDEALADAAAARRRIEVLQPMTGRCRRPGSRPAARCCAWRR
jgi:ATPase subunit of ABC transporter with duplicated ATPase domains